MARAEITRSPSDRPPIVAVLFDAVGTLLYADQPVAQAYESIAARFGSRLTYNEIRRRFRSSLTADGSLATASLTRPPTSEAEERQRWRRIVAQVVHDVQPSAKEELFATLWQHFAQPTSWRFYGDVMDTWRELSRRGYRLGIASNFDSRLRNVLAGLPQLDSSKRRVRESKGPTHTQLETSFAATTPDPDSLFISSEIGFPKPDPRFFQAVQQRLGLELSQILLVGDDWTNDILGGQSAGWSTVWINREGELPPQPVHAIRQLSDLLELLLPRPAS